MVIFFSTLAIQGVSLSVVGWQHENQKINRIANWCTSLAAIDCQPHVLNIEN